jgi:hypothetical protein
VNHRTLLAAGLLLAVAARPVALGQAGQPGTPLTADDLLKVTTASVLDISDDGRGVAYTTRRPLDNATTDHIVRDRHRPVGSGFSSPTRDRASKPVCRSAVSARPHGRTPAHNFRASALGCLPR